nr:HNH endonuclease signature motif containing protein [Stenotrophomonas geniculata]
MNGRIWSADEDETLRINWPRFPAFLIAHVLGRGRASIYRRAAQLGLKKADDFETQPLARLWNGTEEPASVAARFKPGQIPTNKGLRRPGWASGRMKETQFKKGRPASESRNYVPIGTEKVDPKRKVLMRKITDDPDIFPVKRWRPVHVMVWEQMHGEVPQGHIVVFRPGLKTFAAAEITPDRLELVTLAENMRRNSFHNRYPPEIKELIRLKARITRRVNARTKEQSNEEQGQ